MWVIACFQHGPKHMDIIYKGSNPPATWSHDAEPIETGVSAETLTEYFTAGRQANDNYNIIVRGAGYWYPQADPVVETPTQPTKAELLAKIQELLEAVEALSDEEEETPP